MRAAVLALILASCASTPPLLQLDVQGQIVGSSIRELIVKTRNAGTVSEDVTVEITLPTLLLPPAATSTGSMQQRDLARGETTSTLRFTQRALAPGAVAVVRVPLLNRMGAVTIAAWSERAPSRKVIERRDLALTR